MYNSKLFVYFALIVEVIAVVTSPLNVGTFGGEPHGFPRMWALLTASLSGRSGLPLNWGEILPYLFMLLGLALVALLIKWLDVATNTLPTAVGTALFVVVLQGFFAIIAIATTVNDLDTAYPADLGAIGIIITAVAHALLFGGLAACWAEQQEAEVSARL